MREGPLREKHRKTSEGEPQVYSVKKTCGSEFKVCGRAARSVPLQCVSVSHLITIVVVVLVVGVLSSLFVLAAVSIV